MVASFKTNFHSYLDHEEEPVDLLLHLLDSRISWHQILLLQDFEGILDTIKGVQLIDQEQDQNAHVFGILDDQIDLPVIQS